MQDSAIAKTALQMHFGPRMLRRDPQTGAWESVSDEDAIRKLLIEVHAGLKALR
jgi:hypothetical protein